MAQEQVPRHESPYVPESGAVGELGQPRVTEAGYGEGKLQFHEDLNPQSAQAHQQQHPLLATHDANIGHGHEPFGSSGVESEYVTPGAGPEGHHKRGMGEKVKTAMKGMKDAVTGHKDHHHPERSPRFTDKVKDAVTGQKPGQGAATGYATSGGALPGEEDYAGKRVGTGQTGTGVGAAFEQKSSTRAAGVEQKNNSTSSAPGIGEQHHQSGWPQPVPPPGMYNPNLVDPSGVPGGGHFSPHATDSPLSLAAGHDSQPSHLREGRDAVSQAALVGEQHQHGKHYENKPYGDAGAQGYSIDQSKYAEAEGRDHAEHHHGKYPENEPGTQGYTSAGEITDHSKYSEPEGRDTVSPLSEDHHGKHPENKLFGDTGAHGYTPGVTSHSKYEQAGNTSSANDFGGGMQSTPAEPNARHDIPTADNTGGATYTDSAGAVHQEGPRDDNVKKEGLMAKMMDKLQFSPKPKDNNTNI